MLLALLLPALATAHDFEVDGIYYKINGNEATVTFRGYNCSSFYNEYSGPVVIPAAVTYNGTTYPVTSIDALAFIYCEGLTSIVIPNSVTEIGQEAFAYCPGLTSIVVKSGNPRYDSRNNCNAIIETSDNELIAGCKNTIIPNSVTKVGNFAFKGCESLTSIVIPNSVTEIGDRAFYSCDGLTSVNIGNSVTEIGDWAFEGCTGLTSVVVGSGNPRFDSRNNCNAIIETASNTLIYGCKNSTIPNSVTAIGNFAFAYCYGLTSIVIPNSVTEIGNGAFSCCKGLTSVDIPDSVTKIGIGAFEACTRLASIVIPNSVTSIGLSAFYNTAWYNNQPDGLVYAGMVAYEYKGTMPSGTNVTLKEGTLGIAGCAFESCTGLTSIVIPNSVIDIGDGAFYWCTGLTDVYCYIADPSKVSYGNEQFNLNDGDYSGRTLHVLKGKADAYGADENWYPYFGRIVEDLNPVIPSGDVNGDLEVNIADVNAAIDIILNGGENPSGDVNDDGEINIADINAIIDIILGSTWN